MFKVDGAYLYLHYWNRVQEFDLMAPGLRNGYNKNIKKHCKPIFFSSFHLKALLGGNIAKSNYTIKNYICLSGV